MVSERLVFMTTNTRTPLSGDQIKQLENDYVLHPWSRQKGRNPKVITRTDGNYFWDSDGKKYLDFTAQFANANPGHGDSRIIDAIVEHALRLGDTKTGLPLVLFA